jgi:hypothetical protein
MTLFPGETPQTPGTRFARALRMMMVFNVNWLGPYSPPLPPPGGLVDQLRSNQAPVSHRIPPDPRFLGSLGVVYHEMT